jgi:uncharacterized membrane protein YkvI
MSGWRRVGDTMDLHLELFLVFVVVQFLPLFLLRNIDGLICVLARVIRLLYIVAVVVALKRHHMKARKKR